MREAKQKTARKVAVKGRIAVVGSSVAIVCLTTWMTFVAATTTVKRIDVVGSHHAKIAEVIAISGIAVGDTLFITDPSIIADRVRRHSWIKEVSVTRWITGKLHIEIEEREPVALAIDERGGPAFYLDSSGVVMPVDTLARYDVPLIRGVTGMRGVDGHRIADASIREILAALAAVMPGTDALISDVIALETGGMTLKTVPTESGKCPDVRLGEGDYRRKLQILSAFWDQAVVGHTNKEFNTIDLRFSGQVITRET